MKHSDDLAYGRGLEAEHSADEDRPVEIGVRKTVPGGGEVNGITAQGGDARVCEDVKLLPVAKQSRPIIAPKSENGIL